MRAAEIAPAHYLGHLGLPSYPRPAVGPKFKRGAKFVLSPNFKQARLKPKHCSPLVPRLPSFPHSYSVGAKTTSPPAAKPQPPPSSTP